MRHARLHQIVASATCSLAVIATARADIIEVEPFVGDASESFESAVPGFHEQLPILFSDPTFEGEANALIIPAFITSFSSFMGSTITAHSGALFSHMTGPVEFMFFQPTRQFGGFMATNSGQDGGLVEFFNAADELIGTMPLDVTFQAGPAPYTWNGWHSDEPFSRVRVSSNGTLSGFLGFDDLELITTPTPGAAVVLLVGMAGFGRRRRRR